MSALALVSPSLASAAPGDDASTVVHRIAFGSCADQNQPQPIWLAVARRLNNLAVTSVSTLNELLDALYPEESAVVRETATTAAQGASRFAATVGDRWRHAISRNPGRPPTPAADTPDTDPAAAPDAGSPPSTENRKDDA